MKTRKITRKIIVMILVFLAVILVQSTVKAGYWFSARYGGKSTRPANLYRDLVYDSGVYCMQRHVQIFSPAEYDRKVTVTIEGNKCNGTTNRSNAIMGYIFACPDSIGGEKRYTDNYKVGPGIRHGGKRQEAVWYYMNTWLKNCGLGAYCVYGNGGYCNFIKKAENYADNIDSQEKIYTATVSIFVSKSGTQRLMTVTTGEKEQVGTLVVEKKDKDNNNKKLSMGFKVEISGEGWLSGKEGSYSYKNSFKDAKTYMTNPTTGLYTLKGLVANKKYRVWETVSPDPVLYPLSEQIKYKVGYEYDKNKGLRLSNWQQLKPGDPVKLELYNKNVPISISGYVWVDCDYKGRELAYDNLYNSVNDVTLEGIDVILYKKVTSGKEEVGQKIASTKTDKNGKYTFDRKVKYDELDNYYVEFDYTNRTIKEKNGETKSSDYYIPVVYNSKNLNEIKTNGSRALATWMHGNDDANYLKNKTRQARTYRGKNSNYLKVYGLKAIASKLYNSGNRTLEYINLGIRKIHDPNYSIAEDLKYVIIKINNYQYTYEYGKRTIDSNAGVPKVKVENKELGMYTRPISPTDIYHLQKNPTNGIEVYVIYNIMIKDDEVHNEANLYKEKELHVTSLTNTFSTERYELNTNSILNKENVSNGINTDIKKWSVKAGENGKATYNDNNIVVGKDKIVEKYIQFKVKPDEIQRILNIPEDQKVIVDDKGTEGLKETTPPTAKTIGYHIYSRNEYAWENIPNIPKTIDRKSISKEKQDEAPYLIFTLGEERKISGLIFEDLVDMTGRKEGEVLGNGKYDNNEKKVEKVGAVLVNSDGTVVKRYVKGENNTAKEVDDVVYSNSDGTYTITGITPGDYYLKFIYGNDSKINGNIIDIKEYKSTIITNKVIKNAFGYGDNEYGNVWYKHLGDNSTYSVAVDDLSERIQVNENGLTSISAKSPQVDITIENTEKTEKTMNDSLNSQYSFGGFYFGIIKQPKQTLDITKKIVNIKLANVPNIIFDGNPQTDKMPGVTDLDGKDNGGSTYTRVEIDQNSIYGSELTLTYKIDVINTSDVNYYETDEKYKGWYYMFGDYSHSKPAEIQVVEVIDGFRQSLTYISKLENVKEITKSESDDSIKTTIAKMEDVANAKLGDNVEAYEKALSIKGWKSLKRKDIDSVSLEFNKTLSSEDDDLDFIGVAAIHSAKNAVNENDQNNTIAAETIKYVRPVILPEPALAESTITAPTGSLQNIIITTFGIIGVVVLGIAAAVIVKKKKSI